MGLKKIKPSIAKAVVTKPKSILEAFLITQNLLQESKSEIKMILLPQVIKDLEKSTKGCKFSNLDSLMNILVRLVTTYADRFFKGGDVAAKSVFTLNEYSAKESDAVGRNPKLRKQRSGFYNGKEIYAERHLRIGVSNNKAQSLRIGFVPIPAERTIVIVYCMKHPPCHKMSH